MMKKVISSVFLALCILFMGCESCFSCTVSKSTYLKNGEVTPVIVKSEVMTKRYGSEGYINGTDGCVGTVKLSDDKLELTEFMPGDGVYFVIHVTNNHKKEVEFRSKFTVKGRLAPMLIITVNGERYEGNAIYTNWKKIEVGGLSEDVIVTVELSELADNSYCNKDALVKYEIEAIECTETNESETK